jgi:hypothetical protein
MARTLATIGAALIGIVMTTAPASPASQGGVTAGMLTCNVESGWGFIIGSSKEVRCTYAPSKGVPERYMGTIGKVGIDIGYTAGGVLVWTVVAPVSDLRAGALEGDYGGLTASATIGGGLGANVLIGGFDKSIALQPLSIEGNTGLNVAAGIAGMKLTHVRS